MKPYALANTKNQNIMNTEQYLKYSHLWDEVANTIAKREGWNETTDWNEHTYIDIPMVGYDEDAIDGVIVFADGTIEFHNWSTEDAFNWTSHPVEVIEEVLNKATKRLNAKDTKMVSEHGRLWEILDDYAGDANDWVVGDFDGTGTIYMNNVDGYVILFERKGKRRRILKSYI